MLILGLPVTEALIVLFLINVILAYAAYAALIGGSFNLSFPAFVGIGGYSSAILTVQGGFNPIVAAGVGVLVSAAIAVVVGVLLRRLGGVFLAIASVNLVFLVQIFALNMDSVTGGVQGIPGVSRSTETWQLVLMAVVVSVGFWLLARSRMGSAIALRRDDGLLASSLGLDLTRSGTMLVVASAVIASIGGSLRAHYFGFVEPSSYGLTLVVSLVAMVVLGGLGQWAGPILGAAFFTFVPEWTQGLGQWRDIATGVILLAVVRYAPDGLLGLGGRVVSSARMRRSRSGVMEGGPAEAPPPPSRRSSTTDQTSRNPRPPVGLRPASRVDS